ncbi:MAG: hypothetical protein M3Q18_09095 [Actinomycetota bacterium]|nr:hypothetical protein [Actinomycetota bacterium]
MEFDLLPALIAGFVGTVAMTVGMTMGKSMGMTTMDIALIGGGMMSGDERKARRAGMFIHLIVMGTLVFGSIYAFLFQALESASWVTGLIVGVVHGAVVGIMAMPMMGAIHPRMMPAAEGFQLDPPGIMGVNYGRGTPLGLLMGHAVYGVVVALVYSGLV